MRHSSFRLQSDAETGFSLIEVALALAIMAIGLMAIIGLIPHGVQASRDAADNTLVATIAHDTFNVIRRQALTLPWPPLGAPQDVYYDAAGTNQFPAPSAGTYFHVHLVPLATPTLLTITATVTWPEKSLTAKPPDTNVFFTSIANYQQ